MKRFELVKREDHYGLYNEDGHKIAATIDGCNSKLSKQNCDEIFGVVDINKWANEKVDNRFNETDGYHKFVYVDGIVDGFNKAMELNKDKLFTAEDMRQAYDDGMNNIDADGCVIDDPDEDFIDTLKCIQQPTEIEVEIITRPYTNVNEGFVLESIREPKLDENGCLILRKV